MPTDSPEDRAERRRALARQLEEQVAKVKMIHDELYDLVEELKEVDNNEDAG
jgi:hypothetical protein